MGEPIQLFRGGEEMSNFEKAWDVIKNEPVPDEEEESEDWIFRDWENDKHPDGSYQWTMLHKCRDCGSMSISNDGGWNQSRELCSDGGEDHDWQMYDSRPTDEYGRAIVEELCDECGEGQEDCYCQDEDGNYIYP